MKNLIIVGAGNAAREVLQIAKDINKIKNVWDIKGFIADSGLDINNLTNGDFDIIGTINGWQPSENEEFVCAIADPEARKYVITKLLMRKAFFTSIIHPTVRISDYCTIGEGVVLYPQASIGPNAVIGNYTFIQSTSIAHDAIVGDYATISSQCGILGGVRIGCRAFIGNHATLLPGVSVGNNAFVGAGSVVIKDVKELQRVFGNPARKVE